MSTQIISPPAPRYKIDDLGDSLRISTGDTQNNTYGKIVQIITIIVWVVFIVPGLTITSYEIFKGNYVFALFVLMIGVLVVLFLIWRFNFKEIITMDNDAIIVKYQSVWFSPSKRYLAEHISDLRASPIPPTAVWSGRIAFDYGAQTFYIGSGISESEAKQIIKAIQAKFPIYRNAS